MFDDEAGYFTHIVTRGQCLDFIETAHRERIYPLVYCHIALNGSIDIARFKEAVRLSCRYVPEILFIYDFRQGKFIDKGLTADHVVITGSHDFGCGWRWDLHTGPQLKVCITQEVGQNAVLIGMSHILSNGVGFLQYLYLLAALYNGDTVPYELVNVRGIFPILNTIQVGAATQQSKNGKRANKQRLALNGRGENHQCLTAAPDADTMKAIQVKAKQMSATLNDVFLTAYACTVTREWNTDRVLLPCPADLRRFSLDPAALTVANMTGMYRIVVEAKPQYSYTELLKQVHIEMTLQKARQRCFSGIPFLNSIWAKIPVSLLEYLCKKFYHIYPLSYTNFGAIDSTRLHFHGCSIESCFLSGAYRIPSDFQLSISTFQGICTLSSSIIGSVERINKSQDILEQVKRELINWAQEN